MLFIMNINSIMIAAKGKIPPIIMEDLVVRKQCVCFIGLGILLISQGNMNSSMY